MKNKRTNINSGIIKALLTGLLITNFIACKNESKTVLSEDIMMERDALAFNETEVERVARLKADADRALVELGDLKNAYWDLVDDRNELNDEVLQSENPESRAFLAEIVQQILILDADISTQTQNASMRRRVYTEALRECQSCSQMDLQDVEFQAESARLLGNEIRALEISIDASAETVAYQADMIAKLREEILQLELDKADTEERISGLDATSSDLLIQLHSEVSRIDEQIVAKQSQITIASQSKRAAYLAADAAVSAKQALEEQM